MYGSISPIHRVAFDAAIPPRVFARNMPQKYCPSKSQNQINVGALVDPGSAVDLTGGLLLAIVRLRVISDVQVPAVAVR